MKKIFLQFQILKKLFMWFQMENGQQCTKLVKKWCTIWNKKWTVKTEKKKNTMSQ